jgi:hypothetical protein
MVARRPAGRARQVGEANMTQLCKKEFSEP